ncbi:MAG: carbohydrate kinase family protein [Spirochaetia bacterium]|nr:carbohydrate kinase family protein [Spirochaetia bacterium]
MQKQQSQVVVIGDAMMDYQYWIQKMPSAGEDVFISRNCENPGGSGANTAFALAYLQVGSSFCGRVGQDDIGRKIVARMQLAGVDCSCVQYGGKTGYTLTMIDAQGERTMFSYRGSNEGSADASNGLISAVTKAKVLLLSGYLLTDARQSLFAIKMAHIAQEHNVIVALDPSPTIDLVSPSIIDDILEATDVLLPNERELGIISRQSSLDEGLTAVSHRIPCIAVKQGASGASILVRKDFEPVVGSRFTDTERLHAGADALQVVDTTGAGDAFNAGFLASFLKNSQPGQWLADGNSLASQVVVRQGATSLFDVPDVV